MFGGWGVRTLSSDAVAFHPVGYHLGTVWPHDNALIAAGFRRYGLADAAERLFLGLLEAAQRFPQDRLPECFSGFARDQFEVPVRYPVACHPQAWAAGAIPELLTTTLGLEPDGFANRLVVHAPRLPVGIDWVELRGVPVGSGSVHLRFDRDASGATSVDVDATSEGVEVRTIPAGAERPPEEAEP
jgi:glycogen debranching enzyme